MAARRFMARAREVITTEPSRREHDAAEVAGAEELRDSARRLKGGVVKVAQMTAYFSGRDAAVDPAARAALTSLWDDLPPMPAAEARRVVREELGSPPEQLFAEWSETPFASASIGQVHAARGHDGAELAVKVQYPDAAAAIASDLESSRLARQLAGTSAGETLDRAAVDALRSAVLGELDYRAEAEAQSRFAAAYRDDPDVVIPAVDGERSARRVLTMERISGSTLAEVAADGSPELRARAAAIMFRFAFGGPFRFGLVNADPNPGNYLVLPGPPVRVAFLDFGCTAEIDPATLADDRKLWRALVHHDPFGAAEQFRFALTELGMVPDPTTLSSNLYREWEQLLAAPFAGGEFAWTAGYAAALTETTSLLIRGGGLTMTAPVVLLWRQRLGTAAVLGSLSPIADFRSLLTAIQRS